MQLNATKHLTRYGCIFLLILAAACNKHTNSPLVSPSNLHYVPDTAIVLIGTADTSTTPIIDWNGHKGIFLFGGPVPQGVTIDNNSGKISWTSSLSIGTYILPVLASNNASSYDTVYYTFNRKRKDHHHCRQYPGLLRGRQSCHKRAA